VIKELMAIILVDDDQEDNCFHEREIEKTNFPRFNETLL